MPPTLRPLTSVPSARPVNVVSVDPAPNAPTPTGMTEAETDRAESTAVSDITANDSCMRRRVMQTSAWMVLGGAQGIQQESYLAAGFACRRVPYGYSDGVAAPGDLSHQLVRRSPLRRPTW